LNPSVPRDLETLCLKCLEKEPARRYQTAEELADELRRFLSGEPILARPLSRPEKLWCWCRRKPALAGSLSAAALLFLVVAIGSPLVAVHLRQQRQRAEEDLYASNIRLAQQNLTEHQLVPARELLHAIEASPRQREMRGWEWRYLAGQCQSDEVGRLPGHTAWIAAVAFSPDDTLLASVSEDGEVRLWDCAARKQVQTWQAYARPDMTHIWTARHSLAFSPDGQRLATGGADGNIYVWDVGTRQRQFTLSGGGGEVAALAFSRAGGKLVSATLSGTVRWWDLTLPELGPLAQAVAPNFPTAVAFLSDGNTVLVATSRGIKRWDISDPKHPGELPPLLNCTALAISPDGQRLVTRARDADLFHVWQLPTMTPQMDLPARAASESNPAISPDGKWLASGDTDGNITLFDLTRRRANIVLRGHERGIWSLAFAHHVRLLASGGQDMIVRLWDPEAREPGSIIEAHHVKIQDIKFLKDSGRFVTAGEELSVTGTNEHHYSTLKLWEMGKAAPLAVATNLGHPLHQWVSISTDGQFVSCNDAVGGNKSSADTLRVFSLPGLGPYTNWPGGPLAYSAAGTPIVYADGNRLLRRSSHDQTPQLIGEAPGNIIRLVLSPDGQTVVTACEPNDGALMFWNVSERQTPMRIRKHEQGIHMIAFSPDGRWLASCGWDRAVGLWDARARRWLTGINGHRGPVTCVAFSPDSQTLASGSSDGTVRLWHVRTRRELAVLAAEVGQVWAVAFSPDGQWLLAGGSNGRIQQWRAPSWQEIAAAENSK
jgi:eukaryotic-like serine/threonine-protein kinase